VFSLENKLVRGSETHRYHRNEAIRPHRSKERSKSLAYVPGPMIVGPLVHAETSGKRIGKIELVTTHGKSVETDEVLAGVTVVGVRESSGPNEAPDLVVTFHFSSITDQLGQHVPASGTIQGVTKGAIGG
jgi:hypothetical protein